MRTITITAWNRVEYLQRVVSTLLGNNLEGFDLLHIRLEPGGNCEEFALSLGKTFPLRVEVVLNHERRGLAQNPRSALSTVFDEHGSDLNLYLEEDTPISSDVLDIARWFEQCERVDEFMCLNLFTYGMREKLHEDCRVRMDQLSHLFPYEGFHPGEDKSRLGPERPHRQASPFNSLGLVITRKKWEEVFKRHWPDFGRRINMGWNWTFGWLLVQDEKLKTLRPRMNRSTHIGAEGLNMNVTPKNQDIFREIPWYLGHLPVHCYQIVENR